MVRRVLAMEDEVHRKSISFDEQSLQQLSVRSRTCSLGGGRRLARKRASSDPTAGPLFTVGARSIDYSVSASGGNLLEQSLILHGHSQSNATASANLLPAGVRL